MIKRGLKICNFCEMSFKRSEHLSRHVLTHTKVKPFGCEGCEKQFSRLDALKRHFKRHSELQSNRLRNEEIYCVNQLLDLAKQGEQCSIST
jgi:uncharacterized Zn-finger protein